MSRDRKMTDIPEAFRRAFEENGWDDDDSERGEGGNGGRRGPGGQGGRGPIRPWWSNRRVWIFGILFLLFISFNWIVYTYTEWLWFSELGYQSVWLTQWGAQIISFLVFFVAAALIFLVSLNLALRQARRMRSGPGLQPLELPGMGALINGGALFMAFLFGSAAASQWHLFLRFLYRVPFGTNDPLFGQDISFFLFELPFYRFVQGWTMPVLVMTMLGVAGVYAASQWEAIQQGRMQLHLNPSFRRQIALLGALFLGLWAFGYQLEIWELVFAPGGVVHGATYIDINARLLALQVQLALMVTLAVVVLYNMFQLTLRPLLAVAGLWLAATVLLGGLYPGILQRYVVEPNELALEAPYIERNIEFTRLGFGLHDVTVRSFGVATELSQQDLDDNELALENIRVWDYRPLQQTYTQLQALRPYYQFTDIDIDRYEIDGMTRQVMLAARELDKSRLPGQTWVNQKLEFTHGYGLAMNPVDRVTRDGQPVFYVRDLPPRSMVNIELTRPEIYYGEATTDQVYAGSGLREFSYPLDQETVYSSYEGTGGVPAGSFLRQLAFAIRFGDSNIILSQYITPDTRIMYHRQIQQRVEQVAPFLRQDGDPYVVVADGRLFWIMDTYTVSRYFPYSRPVGEGFNYVRNSVKVVIDAYNGSMNFYISDPDDPIIQTYARVFPDLFQPMDELPDFLMAHIRYPEDYFTWQTRQYLTYHMTDVQVFYNREDLWEIPRELFDRQEVLMEPYYVLFRLPGEPEAEYLLIQPYTPANRDNMVAWIAARNDPPHYGELVVYELPRQELVFGPIQVEARIDQDPLISQQLALWDQRGSRVIRGNLIVIPLNRSFLYVEPIYLQAETSALPELQRVIAVSGERVVMRETLTEALTALVEGAPVVDEIIAEPPVEVVDPDEVDVVETPADEPADPLPTAPPAVADDTLEGLIRAANSHFEAAEAAQRRGDWAVYGQELSALQATLERLLEMTGGELGGSN